MYERLTLYGGLIGGVLVLSCLVAFALSTRVQGHISRPVLALVHTATAVADQRDYSMRAEKFADDELGRLTDAFNAMPARIDEQDRALRSREEQLLHDHERGRAEAEIQVLNDAGATRAGAHARAGGGQRRTGGVLAPCLDLRAPLRHVQGCRHAAARHHGRPAFATAQRYLHTITAASVEMGVPTNLLAFARRAESRCGS